MIDSHDAVTLHDEYKKAATIMITLRALTAEDIPNLAQIRTGFIASTVLHIERNGEGLETSWHLVEELLTVPFNRGDGYDFDEVTQEEVRERMQRAEQGDAYQRVADFEGRLIGLVEVEIQEWNNSAQLINLMVDADYRGQGLGRRLWHRAVDFARQSDVRAILVETQNTNVAACRFYARMGCQLSGLHESFYDADPDETPDEVALFWSYPIHMRKRAGKG
jgi:ribosomal protein S18 acetylase RimI-like enzyme